jgi:hypothetical protein
MPKIPTFESQGRPTAEVGGVKTNIQVPLETSLTKMGSTIADYYVKEKTAEANTNALKALSSLYGNQIDGTQGLYSIQDELKNNPNPSQVESLYDQKIKQLWGSAQNSTLVNADNFTRKALEQKFYATANVFKQDIIKGSRDSLFNEQKKITSLDTQQDTINLKKLGENYLSIFNQNRIDNINKIEDLEPQQKKELIAEAISFGHKELAETLIEKSPELFTKLVQEGKLSLDNKTFSQLIDKANKQILNQNQLFFTSDLEISETSTADSIFNSYKEIQNGTFGGDVEKIKSWQNLTQFEKTSIIDYAKKIRSQNISEINNRNTAELNQRKDQSINDYRSLIDNTQELNTINLLKVNELFGEPRNDYERTAKSQMVELSTKIGQKEFSNFNNYYKNFNIQKGILTGEIKDHITPFVLDGETEAKSITQRVGDGISKKEFSFYINYLLPKTNNSAFVDDHKKLYSVIESLQPVIEGPSSLKYLDTTVDNRLNNFQSQMIYNFNQGIKEGKKIDDLLNPTNKFFIGKDWRSFQPDKDYITKIISEKSTDAVIKTDLMPPSWNPQKYKTVEDWLTSQEYKEYELKKKAK